MEAEGLLEALGRQCRELRTGRGLTLRELARHSGLSPRFLVQVEGGSGNISVRNLAHLAAALGTTPAALLAGASEAVQAPVVALLGLRGAGKTSVGRKLARRLRVPFVELDRRVEEAAGLTLAEIFALHGESYFRRLERQALECILDEGRPLVLAAGGGLVTSSESFELLRRRALTVWLRARPEDHWNRVVQQGDRRPMADHPEAMAELRRLLALREPLYAQAGATVDTSGLDVDGAVQTLVELLGRHVAGRSALAEPVPDAGDSGMRADRPPRTVGRVRA
jgi:XRE family aerobic/anaerobic benzoate catabolism transcriptional regulator